MQVTDPRKFWAEIAIFWFPYRRDSNPSVRQNALGMIKSMIAHGKNYRKWKAGTLKNQTSNI